MLVLFETPAGYALFKVLEKGKLKDTDNMFKEFQTPEKASNMYVDSPTFYPAEMRAELGLASWPVPTLC